MSDRGKVNPKALLKRAVRDRIYFSPGNPWPQGHAVRECYLAGRLFENNTLEVSLHLASVDYRENDGGEFLDEGDDSDWGAKVVWNNYHSFSVDGTLLAGNESSPISLSAVASSKLVVDPLPESYERFLDDELSFTTYLLGHDAVADHRIAFGKKAEGTYPLEWTARIALAYSGEHRFERYFATKTKATELREIYVVGDRPDGTILSALAKVLEEHSEFELQHRERGRYLVRRVASGGGV